MRTAQELFTISATHLLKQGCRAETESENGGYGIGGSGKVCCYRGPNNTMCAAGVLIPDSEYKPDMENKSVFGLIDRGDLLTDERKAEFVAHSGLLKDLQNVHDLSQKPGEWCSAQRPVDLWRECLEAVASAHGLQMPEIAT